MYYVGRNTLATVITEQKEKNRRKVKLETQNENAFILTKKLNRFSIYFV